MKKLFLLSLFLPIWFMMWCSNTQTVSPGQEVKQEKKAEYIDVAKWQTQEFATMSIKVVWYEETDLLKSHNEFEDDINAWEYSKFIILELEVLNLTNEPIKYDTYYDQVIDSNWRKFNEYSESNYMFTPWLFFDNKLQYYELKPGIPYKWKLVFEVAKDSNWLWFIVESAKDHKMYKLLLD